MTHTYIIRKTLGIKDKNITFEKKLTEEKIKGQNHLVYFGKLTYKPKGCVKCGVVNHSTEDIVKNGTKTSTIKLTNINFKLVLLKLKKQRFLCRHCGETFIAETNLVNRNCYISNIIKSTISMELAETQAMSLIGKHLNVSSHTVLRQLKTIDGYSKTDYSNLPEHLSLDEFKSVKNVSGAMSLLFIDARTHKPVDIVENRQQGYLTDYFMRYSLKARFQVKTVTIDMYSPYLQVIKDCFPQAEIIIDRFQAILNEAKGNTYPQKIRTALTTLEKYIEAIERAFIYNLSNGPIEGINNRFGPFGVDESLRGLGLGSVLFNEMLHDMTKRGIHHVYFLWTGGRAQLMYERQGMSAYREYELMRKMLNE